MEGREPSQVPTAQPPPHMPSICLPSLEGKMAVASQAAGPPRSCGSSCRYQSSWQKSGKKKAISLLADAAESVRLRGDEVSRGNSHKLDIWEESGNRRKGRTAHNFAQEHIRQQMHLKSLDLEVCSAPKRSTGITWLRLNAHTWSSGHACWAQVPSAGTPCRED